MKFEAAVIEALGTLPRGYYQRVDGLMCEHPVLVLHPHWFPRLRLWLMEKRGRIESQIWPGARMKSYRLPQ